MRKILLPFCLITPLVVFPIYENIIGTSMPDWLMIVLGIMFFGSITGLWMVKHQHHTAALPEHAKEQKDDLYHNDFSKVPYMTTGAPDKPMLMTQDMVAQDLEEQEKLEAMNRKAGAGKKAP